MITATSSIALMDIINLIKDISSLNLGYLGLSITVLVILGGVFYFFNLKPWQEKTEKQEGNLENMRQRLIKDKNEALEKIKSTKTEV